MKKKIMVLALSAFALCFSAEAQQPKQIPRIGYLAANPQGPSGEALRQGLKDLGYLEGKNIVMEYRYSEGRDDRIPSLVAELVQLKVDVLVSPLPAAVRAAKQATTTIPIVMMTTEDPVAAGLVDSLARPGGNITGLARLTQELGGKRLELLKEAVPTISRVGALMQADSQTGGIESIRFKEYEAAARALKIPLRALEVRYQNPDFQGALQAAAKGRVNALITINTAWLLRYSKRIADLAIKNRLPSMHEQIDYVEAGGLMSYASDFHEISRRAAVYVDKILQGRKPADLPVEQPMKFEFVINLKTAKQIGLTIPPNVLARADRVIK
jgi:putative ABC transport system substrate-binding protein